MIQQNLDAFSIGKQKSLIYIIDKEYNMTAELKYNKLALFQFELQLEQL